MLPIKLPRFFTEPFQTRRLLALASIVALTSILAPAATAQAAAQGTAARGTVSLAPLPLIASTGAGYSVLTATGAFYGNGYPTAPVSFQVDEGPVVTAGCSAYFITAFCNTVYDTAGLAPGTHTLRVSYPGDANYGASSSTAPLVVNGGRLTIAVDSQIAVAGSGWQTLTAQGTWEGPMPTGNVLFAVDGQNFQNAGCLFTSPTSVQCTASYPVGALPVGYHQINVVLTGDGNYALTQSSSTLLVTGQ